MKKQKLLCLFVALLLLSSLCACGRKADTSKWQSNETFSAVPVYKYADTGSAEFSSAMNVKIDKADYDGFVDYISDLKDAGFTFLSSSGEPENYSLSGGSASWRGTNGKIWLQLIFNEEGTSGYEMFGCSLQIYGYDSSSFAAPGSSGSKDETENSKGKNAETAAKQSETKSE